MIQKLIHFAWPFSTSRKSTAQSVAKTSVAERQTSIDHTYSEELHVKFYETVLTCDPLNLSKLSLPQTLILEVVADKLRSSEYRHTAVPRLPTVVPQLLKSLRDPDSSASEYVDIIKQDPVLASAVLKMANSAYFNPGHRKIDSFQRAVVTLGLQGMRSLLSSAVMQPIIQCKSTYFAQFGKNLWDHSLNCATSCQLLAKQRNIEPFKAYLAGLVHDIGTITIFTQLTHHFQADKIKNPPAHAFVELIDDLGKELTHWIARDWDFPEDILVALTDQIDTAGNIDISSMGEILYRSNQACEAYLLLKSHHYSKSQGALLLEALMLPENLFEQLDKLHMTSV